MLAGAGAGVCGENDLSPLCVLYLFERCIYFKIYLLEVADQNELCVQGLRGLKHPYPCR